MSKSNITTILLFAAVLLLLVSDATSILVSPKKPSVKTGIKHTTVIKPKVGPIGGNNKNDATLRKSYQQQQQQDIVPVTQTQQQSPSPSPVSQITEDILMGIYAISNVNSSYSIGSILCNGNPLKHAVASGYAMTLYGFGEQKPSSSNIELKNSKKIKSHFNNNNGKEDNKISLPFATKYARTKDNSLQNFNMYKGFLGSPEEVLYTMESNVPINGVTLEEQSSNYVSAKLNTDSETTTDIDITTIDWTKLSTVVMVSGYVSSTDVPPTTLEVYVGNLFGSYMTSYGTFSVVISSVTYDSAAVEFGPPSYNASLDASTMIATLTIDPVWYDEYQNAKLRSTKLSKLKSGLSKHDIKAQKNAVAATMTDDNNNNNNEEVPSLQGIAVSLVIDMVTTSSSNNQMNNMVPFDEGSSSEQEISFDDIPPVVVDLNQKLTMYHFYMHNDYPASDQFEAQLEWYNEKYELKIGHGSNPIIVILTIIIIVGIKIAIISTVSFSSAAWLYPYASEIETLKELKSKLGVNNNNGDRFYPEVTTTAIDGKMSVDSLPPPPPYYYGYSANSKHSGGLHYPLEHHDIDGNDDHKLLLKPKKAKK